MKRGVPLPPTLRQLHGLKSPDRRLFLNFLTVLIIETFVCEFIEQFRGGVLAIIGNLRARGSCSQGSLRPPTNHGCLRPLQISKHCNLVNISCFIILNRSYTFSLLKLLVIRLNQGATATNRRRPRFEIFVLQRAPLRQLCCRLTYIIIMTRHLKLPLLPPFLFNLYVKSLHFLAAPFLVGLR